VWLAERPPPSQWGFFILEFIWALHALSLVNKLMAPVIDWMILKYIGKWWWQTGRVWRKISSVLTAVKYLGMRPAEMRKKKNKAPGLGEAVPSRPAHYFSMLIWKQSILGCTFKPCRELWCVRVYYICPTNALLLGKYSKILQNARYIQQQGHAVAQLVEALRYKSEGRGFDSRWCHWNFSLTYPSGRTMALGLTQPLTEMSTRNISWG